MGEISVRCHVSGLWIDRGTPAVGVFLALQSLASWNGGPYLGGWVTRSLPLPGTYDGNGGLWLRPSCVCQVTAESFDLDLTPETRETITIRGGGQAFWNTPPHQRVQHLLGEATRLDDLTILNEPDAAFTYEDRLEGGGDGRLTRAKIRRDIREQGRNGNWMRGFRTELPLKTAFIRRDIWDLLVQRNPPPRPKWREPSYPGGKRYKESVLATDMACLINGTWCWEMVQLHRGHFGTQRLQVYEPLLWAYTRTIVPHLLRQNLGWAPAALASTGQNTFALQEQAALMARFAELAAQDAKRHRPHPEETGE